MWLSNPQHQCPAQGQPCYACSTIGHYTALCKHKWTWWQLCNTPQQGDRNGRSSRSTRRPRNHQSPQNNRSRGRGQCSSWSLGRQSCHHSPSHSQSHSPSHISSCTASPHQLDWSCCWCTPFQYSQDSLEIISADSVETWTHPEGSLLTERASNSQVLFYTRLQLPRKNGTKLMTVKIDPGAQVNTIPLSRYQKLFPKKVNETRYPEPHSLSPIAHTWISHDGKPKPFLDHFIAKVQHATLPRSYPVHFYVCEDATSPRPYSPMLHQRGHRSWNLKSLILQLNPK